MKRFLGILVCVFAFSACDDGDLVVDTINFDEVQTTECADNNLLFKLKESESLILNIPEDSFAQDNTPDGEPDQIDIDATHQVVYNFYDGKVTSDKICDLIDPGFPNVKTKWKAESGIIEISTDVQKKVNETDKSTRITGYKNVIVFKNITFKKEDGTTQFYDVFSFGDYIETITPLPFAFQKVVNKCDSGLLYNFTLNESLTLNIDPQLIVNEATEVDKPRIGTIELDKNKLVYRFFEGGGVLESTYFCQAKDPLLPTVREEWVGKVGGTIEVTTVTTGANSFKHTIVLKNVSLAKDKSDFQLGNNYIYGELVTIKE